MALFKDASGQLVVAATMPPGGSVVAGPATTNLVDTAPWLRTLDANNMDWHPGGYSTAVESPSSFVGAGSINTNNLAVGSIMAIDYVEVSLFLASQPTIASTSTTASAIASVTTAAYPISCSHFISISFSFFHYDATPGTYQITLKRNGIAIHTWGIDPPNRLVAGFNSNSVALSDVLACNNTISIFTLDLMLISDVSPNIWNAATAPFLANIELLINTNKV